MVVSGGQWWPVVASGVKYFQFWPVVAQWWPVVAVSGLSGLVQTNELTRSSAVRVDSTLRCIHRSEKGE